MFGKPFRVKSSTAIRGSDRRKLKQRVKAAFPSLSDNDVDNIIPNKEEMNVMKILTHSEVNTTFYTIKKNPIFFEHEGDLFPTVYTLWEYPHMVPSAKTWPPVFQKIRGGADLMLPGVVVSPSGLPHYEKGDVLTVFLAGNRAPIAVGVATVSSKEAIENGMRGKGVQIRHFFMDHLWSLGEQSHPPLLEERVECEVEREEIPGLHNEAVGATVEVNIEDMKILDKTPSESTEDAYEGAAKDVNNTEDEVQESTEECAASVDIVENKETTEDLDDDMDSLLRNCFLQALLDAKKVALPLLVSTFSGEYLRNACPNGKQLDVKKSKYKKLSKFLQHMKDEGLIDIKQLSKGVDSITDIKYVHTSIVEYKRSTFASRLKEERSRAVEMETSSDPEGPLIEELYAVSAKTTPLFGTNRKGVALTAAEIRSYVTEYVKTENLADPNNKRLVQLDSVLTDTIKPETGGLCSLAWDALMAGIISRMNPCFRITLAGREPVFRKGKLEPIEVKVEQRMGNKKVTLVKYVELFGIDAKEFAHRLQQDAASSTSVSALPGKNNPGNQVMVQGVQTKHVASILASYNIPKKYITGIEKSKSDKKKR